MNKQIWWVFAGTAGGSNRVRIVKTLNERPCNANQLAEKLDLDYKTIRHHLRILKNKQYDCCWGNQIWDFIFPFN